MDAPYHFNPKGKRLTEIDINDLVFTSPLILDLPKEDAELISAKDLRAHHEALQDTDLLLVRTNWGNLYCDNDPKRYSHKAPGFHSDAGHYLLNETTCHRYNICLVTCIWHTFK